VPRQRRLVEPERGGVAREHLRPEAVERAGRPAELRRGAERGEAPAGGVERAHPARGLEPERGRHGLLEQRAPDHRRGAVVGGEPCGGVRGGGEVLAQRHQRVADDEHRGGVEDVLARGPAMDLGARQLA
jgi:hypothetical protein